MEDNEQKADLPENSAVKSLGNNSKHVLLLVNNPNQPFLDDSALDFTGKWLGAISHTLADTAIVNLANVKRPLKEWMADFSPKTVIAFGMTSEILDLPLQFPSYQVQKYNDVSYLVADELHTISSDPSIKKQFWACLKTAFSL